MSFKTKIIAIVLIACMVTGIIYVGNQNNEKTSLEKMLSTKDNVETVTLWYTDDTYTDYFTNAAVAFHAKNPDIRVIPSLVSDNEFFETAYTASVEGKEYPDLLLLSNDALEKAYLAGLASQSDANATVISRLNFPGGALKSVTYNNKKIAYPLSFETSILLYNKTFLTEWADKVNSGEAESGKGSLSEEELEDAGIEIDEEDFNQEEISDSGKTEEIVPVTYSDFVPTDFQQLKTFADSYTVPEGVETVLKWDVSDIFYNYFFVGNYMVVGGEAGDDSGNIDIYNDNTLACLREYQSLSSFFSIDENSTEYEDVLQDFLDGKTVFTIARSDAIEKIKEKEEQMQEAYENAVAEAEKLSQAPVSEEEKNVEFPPVYDFEYTVLPDISPELQTKPLSVTKCITVNGFSDSKDAANKFAAFVTTEYATNLYQRTGFLASTNNSGCEEEIFKVFLQEYENSIPLPKIVETSNLWVQLEITFKDIWSGEDVAVRFKDFSDQILLQIKGAEILNQK